MIGNKKIIMLIICLLLYETCIGIAQKYPYPIIFVHGLDGSDETFEPTMNELDNRFNLGPINVLDVCLNADNDDGTANIDENGITGDVRWKDFWFEDILGIIRKVNLGIRLYAEDPDDYEYKWLESQIFAINFKEERFNGATWWPNTYFDHSDHAAIYKQGLALREMIREVLDSTKAEKVILVGHSMGGLTIREYLQRTEDSSHKWWINNSEHKVAKVVTIGTPHLGSNFINVPLIPSELSSEAVRDLRYNFSLISTPPDPDLDIGVYLFGGSETNEELDAYHNQNINCNANIDDQITGINSNTTAGEDNPNMPLPNSIDYTWITSDIGISSDGVVRLDRQYLYNIGDTLLTHQLHFVYEGGDYKAIIRGLDEPDISTLAYKIKPNQEYFGIATVQSSGVTTDDDWYEVSISDEIFMLQIVPVTGLSGSISLYSIQNGETVQVFSKSISGNNQVLTWNLPASSDNNNYLIKISHDNINYNSWETPYRYQVSKSDIVLTPDFEVSKQYGIIPNSTIQFTDLSVVENAEITKWEWDFGDGITSNDINPQHTFREAGAYDVTLTICVGLFSKSITKKQFIYIDPSGTDQINITAVEYFFDDDPGIGNGTAIPIQANPFIDIDHHISLSNITSGLHRLYIRSKDANGNWSAVQSKSVLVHNLPETSIPPDITRVEYFFDVDPGYDNGNSFNITNDIEVLINTNIQLNYLDNGLHRLYVRAKNSDGNWSAVQSKSLLVYGTSETMLPSDITEIEYFFDDDPGFSNAAHFSFTPDEFVNINENLNLSETDDGLHRLYVRAKNNDGIWSTVQSKSLLIHDAASSTPPPNITEIECFYDNDPGFGKGIKLNFIQDTIVEIQQNISIVVWSEGNHNIYTRAKNAEGFWSIPRSSMFVVDTIGSVDSIGFYYDMALFFNTYDLIYLNDGDNIYNWPDNTIFTEHSNMLDSLRQPKLYKYILNGAPGLEFNSDDGVGDILESPCHEEITTSNTDEMNPLAEDKSLLIVFKPENLTDRQVIFEAGETTSGFNIYLDNGMLCCGMYNRSERKFVKHDIPLTTDKIYLVHLEYDAENLQYRLLINGAETDVSPVVTFHGLSKDGDSPTGIGGAIGTRFHDYNTGSLYTRTYNGILGDILLYNQYFTPEEYQEIYDYLNRKYSMDWTYPALSAPKINEWILFDDNAPELTDNTVTVSELFPNPFNQKTEFTVYIQQEQPVTIDIYNNIGGFVNTLYQGKLSEGSHSFEIDGNSLIPGIYYMKIVGATSTEYKKMINY